MPPTCKVLLGLPVHPPPAEKSCVRLEKGTQLTQNTFSVKNFQTLVARKSVRFAHFKSYRNGVSLFLMSCPSSCFSRSRSGMFFEDELFFFPYWVEKGYLFLLWYFVLYFFILFCIDFRADWGFMASHSTRKRWLYELKPTSRAAGGSQPLP